MPLGKGNQPFAFQTAFWAKTTAMRFTHTQKSRWAERITPALNLFSNWELSYRGRPKSIPGTMGNGPTTGLFSGKWRARLCNLKLCTFTSTSDIAFWLIPLPINILANATVLATYHPIFILFKIPLNIIAYFTLIWGVNLISLAALLPIKVVKTPVFPLTKKERLGPTMGLSQPA